jgi:hypothetical protein
VPFGASLTHVAVLPPGYQRYLVDPFAEKKRPWKLYTVLAIILFIALGWVIGKFDYLLPDKITSSRVIRGIYSTNSIPAVTNSSPSAAQPK